MNQKLKYGSDHLGSPDLHSTLLSLIRVIYNQENSCCVKAVQGEGSTAALMWSGPVQNSLLGPVRSLARSLSPLQIKTVSSALWL